MGFFRDPFDRKARVRRANATFDVASREAPTEHLRFLHAALEKQQVARVGRGAWGSAEGRICPLTALVHGKVPANDDEAREVAIRAEDLLRAHGHGARDFYDAWDAGLIASWQILRRVAGELSRREQQRRRPRRAGFWTALRRGPRA